MAMITAGAVAVIAAVAAHAVGKALSRISRYRWTEPVDTPGPSTPAGTLYFDDIDPRLLDPDQALFSNDDEVARARHATVTVTGGARQFARDEIGGLLDPVDRFAFEQSQRTIEAQQRAVELDRIEADRAEHHRLLDRIEAIQARDLANQPTLIETHGRPDRRLGPFIAAVALVAAIGYGIVAAGFIAWASSHRLDTAGTTSTTTAVEGGPDVVGR